MHKIKKFIDAISPMNDSDWKLFSSKLQEVKLKKNTTLLKIGKIENHLSFISKGIIRLYIPREESDLTFGFLFDNEFVTGYDSLLTQSPSEYQIETLTETILWRISTKIYKKYMKKQTMEILLDGKWLKKCFL